MSPRERTHFLGLEQSLRRPYNWSGMKHPLCLRIAFGAVLPLLFLWAPFAFASDRALVECSSVYCPGAIGRVAHDTAAKLAIIEIWKEPKAGQHLAALFPQCNATGQAYVLGALWHIDPAAFKRLAPQFLPGPDIEVASFDVFWSESRSNLVRLLQETNRTLAFDNPPITTDQQRALFAADIQAHKAIFERTSEWKQAVADYQLGAPHKHFFDSRTVEIRRKDLKIPYSVDWGWNKVGESWQPSIPIREVTAVIDEIDRTPFIQNLNHGVPLDILLFADHGNFYRQGMAPDVSPQEDEHVTKAKSLITAVGFSGTNRLVQVIARSSQGPLLLWHPFGSHLWVITWNIRMSKQWVQAYEQQTGLQLEGPENAPGWVGTCDDGGVLKMVRYPLAGGASPKPSKRE
jgi:hypothetical protein